MTYMNGVGMTWGHYESIDLNGATYAIKKTFPPGVCSSSGWGMTVNYQMDGKRQPVSQCNLP